VARRKNFRKARPGKNGRKRQPLWKKKKPEISTENPLRVLEGAVVGVLYTTGETLTLDEIVSHLGISQHDAYKVEEVLFELCRRKIIACLAKGRYGVNKSAELLEGLVSINPRGFGFATVENPPPKMKIERDLFIPQKALATAVHGDLVLLIITGKREGRYEAAVIKVLERGSTRIVGIYTTGERTGIVQPENDKFPFSVVVKNEHSLGAKNGEAVVVDHINYDTGHRNPEGRVIEILGNPEDIQVQTEITIHNHELPHVFSEEALQLANGLEGAVLPAAGRLDLRDRVHVTIDGEDARDFDDAVAVEKNANGYRLYVSIADVSHYVTPGTVLDKEAYERGTSVYFPTRVVPMLPERLSNNLCSLVPGEDRYAFTAILEFDESGRRISKKFSKSIIKSHYRLTYTEVKKMLLDHDDALCQQYNDIQKQLLWMGKLAEKLEKERSKRGSIGFELPEAQIELGQNNTVENISRRQRNLAHKLIEEFMLAANEAVAETFMEQDVDGLYRIHEPPDPDRVEEFSQFAQSMGLMLPKDQGTPKWFGKVLQMVAGKPLEYIVNNLLLRSMKQARYSDENVGHFGLAAQNYTHFTSPIRRYPDLIVHRVLAAFIGHPKGAKSVAKAPVAGSLADAGEFLSRRERVAVEAEREMVDRLKVLFMADKVGEEYEGIISGVTSFGLFIELLEYFISGAIAITDLSDDYYHIDEKNHRLIGSRTNKTYQIGDILQVRVDSVDVRRRRINFKEAEN
jgi:ribonuclease R